MNQNKPLKTILNVNNTVNQFNFYIWFTRNKSNYCIPIYYSDYFWCRL